MASIDLKLPILSSLGLPSCPRSLDKPYLSFLALLMPCMDVKLATLRGISVLRDQIYSLGIWFRLEVYKCIKAMKNRRVTLLT